MSETTAPSFETLLIEKKGRVGLITLNRPQALNALNMQVLTEITEALGGFATDNDIGCVVLTGSAKAFAAGADIKEMQPQSYTEMFASNWFSGWESVTTFRKPIIAAVAGYALGGGCELAMMCDIILAAESARFGQPEIKIGAIPGMGGSQRLTRAIGKSKSMEMCLTGRMMDAAEAERANLVARIVPNDKLLEEAMQLAETIAGMSLPLAMMVKEAVNRAFEVNLAEGIHFERRLFHSVFATADQKEGMTAFVEKRPPNFTHR